MGYKDFIAVLNKPKYRLTDKRIDRLVLLLSFTGRIIQVVFYYNIRVDRSLQLLAMQNFVYGHGITLAKVLPDNLSRIVYEPLIKWPPGYSLLVAPFYLLFNENYIWSTLAIDISFALLQILICRKILRALDVPNLLISLFTLLCGFFLYDFYAISSSDAIAITLFLIAVYFTILILKHPNSLVRNTFFSAICLFMCGLLKYLYIPIVFIIPVFLFFHGFVNGEPLHKKSAIFIFSFLAVTMGALLFYQKTVGGSAVYISQPQRGIFTDNLSQFYPFFPASFIKPSTIESLGLRSDSPNLCFQIIHLIVLALAIVTFAYTIFRYGLKNRSVAVNFLYLSFAISFSITLLLFYLSFTVQSEEYQGSFWTYVQEPRYYGLVLLLVQLCVFVVYSYWNKKKSWQNGFLILILLFSIEIFHGIYFDYRRITFFNKEQYSWQYEKRFQEYADSIIQEGKIKYKTKKLAITGSSFYFNARISLFSHVPVMEQVQTINNTSSIKSKEPAFLLTVLEQKDSSSYSSFLSGQGHEAVGNIYGFNFYTVYVKPD